MKKTKIICSIGPSSSSVEVMEKMVAEGMNVARINFSHATLEERINVINVVKEVRKKLNEPIGILFDTKGPEFRNQMMENGEVSLIEGRTIRIVKDEVLGNEKRFSLNHPEAIDDLKIGDIILLENGLMKIEVISVEEDGVTCKIIDGGKLGNKKSLNVPGVNLSIPFISEEDYKDLTSDIIDDGDFIALSFVSNKDNVIEARQLIKNKNIKLIAKIENQEGIKNLDEILEVADGAMVARGDLGVEVPLEMLPIYQKQIIKKCRKYGKIAIVATEMLESMKKNIRPTRAEVSDVANAVLDGTDAVMLSGETTTGKHPIDVVKYMSKICLMAENNNKDVTFSMSSTDDIAMTIAKSVVECSKTLSVEAIVVAKMSGNTAIKISNLKPSVPIIAACTTKEVAQSLSLNYGVYSRVVKEYDSTDEIVEDAKRLYKEMFNVGKNDIIIITGGFPNNTVNKTTNFMKIERLN